MPIFFSNQGLGNFSVAYSPFDSLSLLQPCNRPRISSSKTARGRLVAIYTHHLDRLYIFYLSDPPRPCSIRTRVLRYCLPDYRTRPEKGYYPANLSACQRLWSFTSHLPHQTSCPPSNCPRSIAHLAFNYGRSSTRPSRLSRAIIPKILISGQWSRPCRR